MAPEEMNSYAKIMKDLSKSEGIGMIYIYIFEGEGIGEERRVCSAREKISGEDRKCRCGT